MNKKTQILKLQLIILFLLMVFSCKKQEKSAIQNTKVFKAAHPQFSSKFESQLKSIYKENALFGDFIFAVVDENGLAYSFALNQDIIEGKKSSLNNNTPIYVASHTKSFTGTLLKILEHKKILDLHKSLNDYLPLINFNNNIDNKTINLKSYLNHTHGVLNNALTWKTAFLGYSGNHLELIKDLNNYSRFDTTRQYRYSNVGPIISAMVVENVTGKTWKSEMKTHIFNPLEMEHTSANVSDYELSDVLPSYTVSKAKGIIAKGFYKNDTTMHAAGGIISTINDMSKWLTANINQDSILLDKNSWSALHSSTTLQDRTYFTYRRTGYSLGWDIAEYQDEITLTRFGGLAGISFHTSFIPTKKIGIIAFSNDNRAYLLPHLMANYAYNLVNGLSADNIFEQEKLAWNESFERENEDTHPKDIQLLIESADADKILGQYINTENWPAISIESKDNNYVLHWGALNGKLYKNKEGNYFSNLGVLTRSFNIRNDTLFTGSLIYKKTNSK